MTKLENKYGELLLKTFANEATAEELLKSLTEQLSLISATYVTTLNAIAMLTGDEKVFEDALLDLKDSVYHATFEEKMKVFKEAIGDTLND